MERNTFNDPDMAQIQQNLSIKQYTQSYLRSDPSESFSIRSRLRKFIRPRYEEY